MDTKVALKRCCKVKWVCINRCLRYDQYSMYVGVDPAHTTVLVVQSIFNISDYQAPFQVRFKFNTVVVTNTDIQYRPILGF